MTKVRRACQEFAGRYDRDRTRGSMERGYLSDVTHRIEDGAAVPDEGCGAGTATGNFHGEERLQASVAPSEYENPPPGAGFTAPRHERGDPDCGFHTAWPARYP
jgi:hypothetical protein